MIKKLLISTLLILTCISFSKYYVQDDAKIIPINEEQILEKIIWEWTKQTKHQMAIITVKNLQGISIEEYANKKFSKIGIGRKEKDDGILFLIAPTEKEIKIEVGYGLEGYLPDGLVGEIRDKYILPHFKKNDYVNGILMGTQAIILYEAKNEGITLPQINSGTLPETGTVPKNSRADMVKGFFIIVFIVFLLKRFPTLRSILIASIFYNMGRSGYRSSYSSFGGGLGGFGGGMSGGGGASGSW